MKTYPETIVDGDGIRYSIYLAGCNHACKGCQNPKSWNPCCGVPLTDDIIDKIINEINNNPLLDGITLSGGDPFYNPEALLSFVKRLKEQTGQNIWCYTGYTLEVLQEDEKRREILPYLNVLVDGRFVEELYNPNLRFRGSSNQRILERKNEIWSIID